MRQPSNKKPGGEVGHKGSTLKMVDIIVKYNPEVCQGCDENLKDVEGETVIQRQVFHLPTLKLQVTEHQVQIKVCPKCDYENQVQFPQQVTQPTQYGLHLTSVLFYLNYYQSIPYHHLKQLIKDIFRANISQGTLANMIKRLYDVLEPIQIAIKENLLSSNFLHLDETGCYVNRKRHWLHFTSNKNIRITLFMKNMAQKSLKRMEFYHLSKEQLFIIIELVTSNMRTVRMGCVMFTI